MGFRNLLLCAAPRCASHLHWPPSSLILITNSKTKRQSRRCVMRPVFRGLTRNVLASEKSTGYEDPPVVFLYTVHLPIKMQMRSCLQLRHRKQWMKWRRRKKERQDLIINWKTKRTENSLTVKSSGDCWVVSVCICMLRCECINLHISKEIRALGSLWKPIVKRKAEGDCCIPQRCMTHHY